MAFNLEQAVQQGFNRDIETNDFNVEAQSLEIVLGDNAGATTFTVKDSDNVKVAEVTSDGYLSVLGNAEVHGGNVLVKGTAANTQFVTLEDGIDATSVFVFDTNPDGVVVGTKGSFGTSYNDGYLYINIDDNTAWKRVAYRSEIDEIPQATNEPSGFADKNDSKMEFTDSNRTFTITPRDAGYDIYLMGKKVTIGNVRTATITDVEGMHFVYYDYADDQLKSTTVFSDDIIKKHAFAAAIYWDATNKTAIYFGDERHGITMDGATHWYLHNAFGARWLGGLALGSFTFGNGSADADAKFAATNGSIADEDLVTNLTDDSPQDISTSANIPIYYRTGSTPVWRKKNADEFPFIYDGTAGYTAASGRIPYNEYTGGAWQLTEATANNNYVLMHYFATNNLVNDTQIDAYGEPFVGIIGESVHATLAAATEAAKSEINNLYVSGMPVKEFVPIATCILQTNGTYTNEPNARFVVMADGSDYVDWRVEQPVPGLGVSVVDHGSLTGLEDDDHPQYLRTDGTRKLSAPWDANNIITAPQIRSDGVLSLDGQSGIVLDGYGQNVIPADSCTDSLGDATHGWTDIYLCNGTTVVGLNDNGGSSAPNSTSGAYVVGTNSANFIAFGPAMGTNDTVQGALEAIDGYLQALTVQTFQQVYNNSCGNESIVMSPECGPIYFEGTEQVVFDNIGGVDITNDLIVRGDITINGTTSTVNTANLYVEDRMIRLNVGAIPAFNGTVGFEAEVGSDGYVEFHWDDSDSRWEISIDRNATPGSETFRPLPYLSSTAATLDLSSIGTNGYPTAGPNPDAGASVVNTNASNFPYTFGPTMDDNSVQAALEAIDGYFLDMTAAISGVAGGLTLQDIINNSCPDPTITLTCGDLTFNGPGEVIFNTPTNITQEVTITGGGPVNINVSGDINLDGYNVTITSTNTSTINGENGIVLDGYGQNVIPGDSCTDSLGDPAHGWTDIYLCSGSVVIGLNDAGDVSAPNNESGAYVVGTNSTNFLTFGSDMTGNTVQAALEAIDGYLADIVSGDVYTPTFQDVYDASCPDPTINLTCGDFTFNGPGGVVFNTNVDFTDEVNISGTGPVVIDVAGNTNISSGGDVNIYAGDTATISGANGIVLDGYGNDVIPAGSCTDSLGDATHGWTDIYLCSGSAVIGLNDAGDVIAPNNESGAYVVGTNNTNFTNFGSTMLGDTVQQALEAIDGYLGTLSGAINGLTLQDIYNQSCPNPTIDLTCGDMTFNGPGEVIFNTPTNITQEVTITGGGPVNINVSGDINLSGDNVTITSTNTSTINGENGIVLDGYGQNVIPGDSCTDSLGDATHGWTDIYLCNGTTVIGLNDAGGASAPNSTSGAYVVGVNSENFTTFGPAMGANDTVQGALEAIDGYLASLNIDSIGGTYTETRGLDINGAVLNGVVKVATDAGTPALDFNKSQTGRAGWTIPVPSDWDEASDIAVSVIWSPEDSSAGNVEWRLEYKSLALTELSSSASSTDDYLQAAAGTTDAIQTTGANLVIPASAISMSDEIIVINVVRRGSAGTDTYNKNAQIHLVKYSYQAKNIV